MNRFVEAGSVFEERWKKFLEFPERGITRWYTFKAALNIVSQKRHGPEPLIVETGCVRAPDDYGAGYSTVLFTDFLWRNGGKLITVDTSLESLLFAGRALAHENEVWGAELHTEFVEDDSVHFLSLYERPEWPDLIYLDSLDYNEYDPRPSQLQQLREVEQAISLTTVILLDDCKLPEGGKGKLAKDFLDKQRDWICLLDDYQSLWIKKESIEK